MRESSGGCPCKSRRQETCSRHEEPCCEQKEGCQRENCPGCADGCLTALLIAVLFFLVVALLGSPCLALFGI